jgi:glycosyltransferase involved in cell wall biosynthesis
MRTELCSMKPFATGKREQTRDTAVHILVDTLADKGLMNAQMSNGREIMRRLDPERFHVSTFHFRDPDEAIAQRPNTRLISLPRRRQTVPIAREFFFGKHDILFYVKSSPASRLYMAWRKRWKDKRITIGTIESQSNLRQERTIPEESVRLWEQTVLRCDYLFSNSDAVRRSLSLQYGLGSELVPTGVDTQFFSPMWDRLHNPRPRVLFVGSLRPFKQPDLLLEAAARFSQADFVLAGDGVMARELAERIHRERLSNLRLLGALGAEELRREYQQADVFLFPSVWEGSPKVILEAAACGLPVIARQNYRPETVLDGKTGYLAGSDKDLFVRLEELLSSPERRRAFGEAGRKHILQYDWDLITRRWEEIFLGVTRVAQAA